jgi:beta-1,4-mannosyltransferase
VIRDPATRSTGGGPLLTRRLLSRAVRVRRRLAVRVMRAWRAYRPQDPSPDPVEALRQLDEAVAIGDREAARRRADGPSGFPGSPAARGRAAALAVLAADLTPSAQLVERAVITYLRTSRPRRETAGRGPLGTTAQALAAARRLREAGHGEPRVVVTLPALEGNPWTDMMERAYDANGLAALHVDGLEDAAAAIDARRAGGFDAVLHVNASNRLVWTAKDEAAATAAVSTVLRQIDKWRADGVPLVVTVHDGPILGPVHADAERSLAQGIADRAAAIHVLTRTTPRVLGGWLRLDPAKIVHLPHPRFDGIYAPLPPRAEARAALGLDPRDPADDGPEIVLGMLGILSARKGPLELLEALAEVPEPLPDGRRLRLILGGRVVDPGGEALIRAAYADARVTPVLGQIATERMPWLLAAIDVAVVPYQRYLNSGWTVLAVSSSIPVIAPAHGTATEVVLPEALVTFDPRMPGSLATALRLSRTLLTREARAAARRSVESIDIGAVSGQFAALLRGLPVRG